jgi:hypothetical protein
MEHYSRGDYFDSLTNLHKAVKSFKIEKLDDRLYQENETVYSIIKDCHLFSASCYIKINQFDPAIQLMNELLDIEPQNAKALFLRGRASYHMGDILPAY